MVPSNLAAASTCIVPSDIIQLSGVELVLIMTASDAGPNSTTPWSSKHKPPSSAMIMTKVSAEAKPVNNGSDWKVTPSSIEYFKGGPPVGSANISIVPPTKPHSLGSVVTMESSCSQVLPPD